MAVRGLIGSGLVFVCWIGIPFLRAKLYGPTGFPIRFLAIVLAPHVAVALTARRPAGKEGGSANPDPSVAP